MKSLLISLISYSAILLAVSGQFSSLSPSYSLRGAIVRTENNVQVVLAGIYSVSFGASLRLQFANDIAVSNILRLYRDADTRYLSVNGECDVITFNSSFRLTNRTHTTLDGITYQVTILNEIPVSLTFSFGTIVIAITVTNFNNRAPDFYSFSTPNDCPRFTCDTCYQPYRFPVLSPSYSVSGIGLGERTGQASTTFTFELSIDIDRQLQRIEESDTTSGNTTNFIEISSDSDKATYNSVDGVCVNTTTYNPLLIFPIDTNVWDLYAAGTESPTGTYSFIYNYGILHRVVIEDGLPIFLGFAFRNTIITINIDSFRNKTPDYSTFCLPSECSVNECNACYSGVAAVASSVLLLLSALLLYLFSTH